MSADLAGKILSDSASHFAQGVALSRATLPGPPLGEKHLDLAAKALAIYRARRARSATFCNAAMLFAEPAWDILLDLYVARCRGYEVSVSDACVAAAVPITTGLRWLARLEKQKLLVRTRDRDDHRRSIVRISELATEMMERWLTAL